MATKTVGPYVRVQVFLLVFIIILLTLFTSRRAASPTPAPTCTTTPLLFLFHPSTSTGKPTGPSAMKPAPMPMKRAQTTPFSHPIIHFHNPTAHGFEYAISPWRTSFLIISAERRPNREIDVVGSLV